MLIACGLSIRPGLAPVGSAEFRFLEEALVDGRVCSVCSGRLWVIVHTGGHAARQHRVGGAVVL